MTFAVRWPDGAEERLYSPSLVVHDHLAVGGRYTVDDFVARSTRALRLASDRVAERFGMRCTSAEAQADEIRATAARFDPAAGPVEVLAMEPPLPGAAAVPAAAPRPGVLR
ncbi:MSMEG_0570 family nitrogen starvation response protein [Cellulomonas endophytica]|uniref:MSMEG_0570 family nitrogen starvation response protein n=1 Tax=Cellulomonas endophytica TaxID=2494735 RepID=UPI001F0C34BB|nr:MSMEG_0570 family nitrogen starvation response protein [Cellulomonas endophytica]